MNKLLLIAAATGVLFAIAIAFAIIIFTANYDTSTFVIKSTFSSAFNESRVINAPVYILSNANYIKLENVSLAQLNSTIENSSDSIDEVRANISLGPAFTYNYYALLSNQSQKNNVFYVQPNLLIAKPNTTVSFTLYFNMTYYKLYNDSIYSDEIKGYVYNFHITPLGMVSNGLYEYQVTMQIGNVKPGTLILLPVYDMKLLEIQYIIILVN
ncbi:hypothetical protein SJAV_05920 [Sulfurisphaera javensis]|uniref:Uncharacterized protein n=1 Tax=Sulfurisphaera javensis TaxID=2049879 RepID=A0AAT9GP54_9CREN